MTSRLPYMLLLCALSASMTTGCPPKLTCEDVGCAFRETCNTLTGQCEAPQSDCRESAGLCDSDEFCDDSTGRCLSNQVSCVNQQACPRGQVCNAQRGICQNIGNCLTNEDCALGQRCDTDSGSCRASTCARTSECIEGFVCVEGACTQGCDDSAPCPDQALCRQEPEATFGQCVSSCTQDTDCIAGRRCNTETQPAVCVVEDPCDVDSACREDEVCVEQLCTLPACTSDASCPENQRCDELSGQCLGGQCTEDALSPNHGPRQAQPLLDGTVVGLVQCPGRPDWYRVTLRGSEVIEIDLRHEGPEDVDLILYDDNLRPLAQDQRLGPLGTLSHQSTRPQTVLLRVDGPTTETVPYSLSVVTRQVNVCVDDALEDNDSAFDATPFVLAPQDVINVPTNLCGQDEDWYALGPLDASNALNIALTPAPGLDVQATLWGPEGEKLQFGETLSSSIARVGEDGVYLLRVKGLNGTEGAVRLSADVTASAPCTAIAKPTSDDAEVIAINEDVSDTLCPQEDAWALNWYKLAAPDEAAVLDLYLDRISALNIPEHVEVTLFAQQTDGSLQTVRRSQSSTTQPTQERLSAEVAPAQTLFIRVSSPNDLARVIVPPAYRVRYRYAAQP